MDSRDSFKQTIFDHYKNNVKDRIPFVLLNSICDNIADHYYDQYTRFRREYPKSTKRYSTFQLTDLDHPQTMKIVIDFLKKELPTEYRKYSLLMLGLSDEELDKFEKWQYNFERL